MQDTADQPAPEGVDPEFVELPAPPQGRRLVVLALMALVVVCSAGLAWSLRHDVAYFFAPPEIRDLGDATQIDPARLETNVYVRLSGTPMLSRAVRYRRVLTGSEHVVFPLAGQRTIYVHVDDTPDALARTEFTGRLVTFGALGRRITAVQRRLATDMGLPVSSESFLLLADEPPGSYAWALLLAILCLLFIAGDVVLFFRWFRPGRDATSGDAAV